MKQATFETHQSDFLAVEISSKEPPSVLSLRTNAQSLNLARCAINSDNSVGYCQRLAGHFQNIPARTNHARSYLVIDVASTSLLSSTSASPEEKVLLVISKHDLKQTGDLAFVLLSRVAADKEFLSVNAGDSFGKKYNQSHFVNHSFSKPTLLTELDLGPNSNSFQQKVEFSNIVTDWFKYRIMGQCRGKIYKRRQCC